MHHPISLSHLTALELTPVELVEVAAAAGYDAVDLRLAPATPLDRIYPVFGETPMLREIRQRLTDTGLKVFDVEIIRIKRGLVIANFEPLFVAAATLGAQRIKVVSDEPDETALSDLLAQLCAAAAPHGLTVDLEFMRFTEVKTIAQATRVVRRVRESQPNCCVLIDSLHFCRSGGQRQDLDSLDASLFHYLQLCDAPARSPDDLAGLIAEARTNRRVPGDGELPLAAIISAMPAGCTVSLEVPMTATAPHLSALERATRCIEGARRALANREGALPHVQ